MKKLLMLALAVFLCAALSGCACLRPLNPADARDNRNDTAAETARPSADQTTSPVTVTPEPAESPTPEPTNEPSEAPQVSEPQEIQFPIAP